MASMTNDGQATTQLSSGLLFAVASAAAFGLSGSLARGLLDARERVRVLGADDEPEGSAHGALGVIGEEHVDILRHPGIVIAHGDHDE